jgi:NAD(P)-dependent dehydrogenase (short-subunit alcohol dehydrogenase family)
VNRISKWQVAGVVSVLACASSNPRPSSAPPETIHVRGASGNFDLVSNRGSTVITFTAPLERVWLALPAAYEAMEIPIADFDAQTRLIGNSGLKVRRRLGKTSLSRFLECGSSQIGPNADEYEVTLSVLSRVHAPDSSKTTVTTTVDASAKGLQFGGQSAGCSSKAALEARLHEALKAELAK